MADTKTLYTGNGTTKSFAISFPYLDREHVRVYQDGLPLGTPGGFSFTGDSTIEFLVAPPAGAAIEIKRVTPSSDRLVNFQNAAVLTSADLNIDSKQSFFLLQEVKENYDDLINNEILRIGSGNGIVSTDPETVIANLVASILNDETAANLEAALSDISANGQSIINLDTLLDDEVSNRIADVLAEAGSRITGDNDLQTQINALVSATVAEVYVQPTEPVAGVGGIPDPIPNGARWYDSDDANHAYLWDGTVWQDLADPQIGVNKADITALDVRLTTAEGNIAANANALSILDVTVSGQGADIVANASAITQLQTDVGGNTASILAEQTARSDADSALASDITLLQTNVGGNAAAILAEQTARSTADSALATDITALQAETGDNAAAILTEQTARTNADSALASDITALQTSVAGNTASISSESTARSTADAALAATIALIGAENAGQTAFIFNTNTVKIDSATGDSFATRFSALATADSANAAAVATEQTARINADGALASDITTVQTQADGNSASITTQSTAIDGLKARYGVALDVNGYLTGFLQNNDGSSGQFLILADKFSVVDPAGGAGQVGTQVFTIENGNVVMSGNLLAAGSVIASKLAANSVTLTAMANGSVGTTQIIGGAITTGKLTADLVLSTKIRTASSGKRVEIDGTGTYPIWVGDGAKNDANANFFIDSSGNVKYSGILEAGLIKSSLFAPATVDDPFKIAVDPSSYSAGSYTGKKAHFFPIRQINFMDDASQYGTALTSDKTTDFARFYSPTYTGSDEYGRLGSFSETFLAFFSMNCLGSSYREINCYLEYRYDSGTWREAYKLYTRVNDSASPSAMQTFISKDTSWTTLDFRLRVNAPVNSNVWLRSCSLCVFTPNFGYGDLPLGTAASGATTGTYSAADVGDYDDLNLTKKWL